MGHETASNIHFFDSFFEKPKNNPYFCNQIGLELHSWNNRKRESSASI